METWDFEGEGEEKVVEESGGDGKGEDVGGEEVGERTEPVEEGEEVVGVVVVDGGGGGREVGEGAGEVFGRMDEGTKVGVEEEDVDGKGAAEGDPENGGEDSEDDPEEIRVVDGCSGFVPNSFGAFDGRKNPFLGSGILMVEHVLKKGGGGDGEDDECLFGLERKVVGEHVSGGLGGEKVAKEEDDGGKEDDGHDGFFF